MRDTSSNGTETQVPAPKDASLDLTLSAIGAIYAYATDPADLANMVRLFDIIGDLPEDGAGADDPLIQTIRFHLARASEVANSPEPDADMAYVLLDNTNRVVAANAEGRSLVEIFCDGVIPDAPLRFHDADMRKTFTAALEGLWSRGGGMHLLRLRNDEKEQTGFVYLIAENHFSTALSLQGLNVPISTRPLRALVAPAQTHTFTDEVVLQDVIGLTGAEARLAQRLQANMTVAEAADELGIAVATARNQVRSIFDKLSVTRQSEMVRDLFSLGSLASTLRGLQDGDRAATAVGDSGIYRFLDLGSGHRLAWREYGAANGLPVFLLASWTFSSLQPVWVHEAAVRHDIRLIAIERPGTGLSTPDNNMTHASFAEMARRLADELGLARFRIMGNSTGAAFGLAIAAYFPDRVEALLLRSARLAAPARAEKSNLLSRSFYHAARRMPRLIEATGPMLRNRLSHHLIRSVSLRFFAEDSVDRAVLEQDQALLDYITDAMVEALARGYGGIYREAALAIEGLNIAPDSVRAPVVAWHGEQNRVVPPETAEASLKDFPTCELRIIPNEGHLLHSRRWDDAFACLRDMA